MSLPSEAPLAKELAGPENCNDGLLPLVGKDGDFDLPLVNKKIVSTITLSEPSVGRYVGSDRRRPWLKRPADRMPLRSAVQNFSSEPLRHFPKVTLQFEIFVCRTRESRAMTGRGSPFTLAG